MTQAKLWLSGRHTDKYALVDQEDYDALSQYKWYLRNDGYVAAKDTVYLHRMVMSTPQGMHTDHLNHDKLDNRKENLRICTPIENMQNTKRKHRGCVKKLPGNNKFYYYGELRKDYKRYMTITCENEEQARGALKQMIKEKGL